MNSAGRILEVLNKFQVCGNPGHSMLQVWSEVFAVPDSPNREDEVVLCIQALRAELDLLRDQLSAIGVPGDLLHTGWARVRNAATTAQLNAGWSGFKEDVCRPEVLLVFQWANWALRTEVEEAMPDEEMSALLVELDSLEQAILAAEMTPWLRDFVQRQVGAIRSALRVCRIRGVKPIEEALHQVAGAYTIEKSRVAAEHKQASDEAKNVLARAGELVEKTAKVADNMDKIRKAGEGFAGLAASVGPMVLGFAHNLLK